MREALTDTAVRQVKHSGKPHGDKHSDGGGLYLLVKAAGKYWRMKYRYGGKEKMLALGVYPAVSLEEAREARDAAQKLLKNGIDPGVAKRQAKAARIAAANDTFEKTALEWLKKTAADRKPVPHERIEQWLRYDALPCIGRMPISISALTVRDVLELVMRKIEARGAAPIDNAKG
jgi:hypothetical protein